MATKKNQAKNDVARRLAAIQKLFAAAETKKIAKGFEQSDDETGITTVSDVDALEDITTFQKVTAGADRALKGAIDAFGGYASAQYDGDVRGAAAQLHDDVRALTNVALALSPPSRAFYNQVLGGLVEVEHVQGPPDDGGPVPYPPIRVALEQIERRDGIGRHSNGVSNGGLPRDVARLVDAELHALFDEIWSSYMASVQSGSFTPTSFASHLNMSTQTKPLVSALGAHDTGAYKTKVQDLSTALTNPKRWSGDPGKDWLFLRNRFKPLFELVRES